MKALILASGIAKRLRPLTNHMPKCLVKVNDKSILDIQLIEFCRAGIKNVVITTGPFEDKVIQSIEPHLKNLDISLVKNDLYDKTNYIYSIYKARHKLDDDIVLIHGDLVFSHEVLPRLLNSKQRNSAIVAENHRPPKDFKALIKNNRIMHISTALMTEESHFLAPLYSFSKGDFKLWLKKIETYIHQKKVQCYAEDALNELLIDEIELKPVYIGKETCMEIDEWEDLETAKKIFGN